MTANGAEFAAYFFDTPEVIPLDAERFFQAVLLIHRLQRRQGCGIGGSQALANATARRIEVSPEREATTLGAAHAAGLALGAWKDESEVASTWQPKVTVEPISEVDRERWADTLRRAERWFPDLSAISF